MNSSLGTGDFMRKITDPAAQHETEKFKFDPPNLVSSSSPSLK
jgi:hypothetical protein